MPSLHSTEYVDCLWKETGADEHKRFAYGPVSQPHISGNG